MELKDYMPILSKLVYPALLLILALIFNKQFGEIYSELITKGRGGKIGGFFEISERANNTKISLLSAKNLGIDVISDFQPEDNQEASQMVTKSSEELLYRLREQLENNPNSKPYKTMVLEYVYQLGVETIVFINNGKYEGLIESNLLLNQINENDYLSYQNMMSSILGINKSIINENKSSLEVLKLMEREGINKVGIVTDSQRLNFIAERETILSKLVTSMITVEE